MLVKCIFMNFLIKLLDYDDINKKVDNVIYIGFSYNYSYILVEMFSDGTHKLYFMLESCNFTTPILVCHQI